MDIKMIIAVFSFIIAVTSDPVAAVTESPTDPEVNLTSQWKTDFGWQINCTWQIHINDSLMSVRLSDHERQFLVFRPETYGPKHRQLFQLPDKTFQVECDSSDRGGKCVMTLEPYQPMTEDLNYQCEVSGERPWFRMKKKSIDIPTLVPPSEAVIEVAQRDPSGSRVVLNCTSSGLPAPTLLWSIGETRVPSDFSGKAWNMTSKLWHTWSLLSFSFANAPASCLPESSKSGVTVKGTNALYSSASENKGTTNLILGVVSLLALRRL